MQAELQAAETSVYAHLIDKAATVADAEPAARKLFIRQAHWVGYPQAKTVLERLELILSSPRVDRMECMLIVAATNNGKTRLLRRFLDLHPPLDRGEGGITERPVLAIQAPPVPDEKRLYGSILSRLGGPGTSYQTAGQQYLAVEKTLKAINLKVLIIDEIQHLISGSTNKHRDCMNALKFLSNDLQISLVGAGIKTAHYALANWDQQLENRFKPVLLPQWSFGPELAQLLMSIEQVLPLRKPSNLGKPEIVQLVADLCDGKIGEIWTLLGVAAFKAIDSSKEFIDLELLKSVQDIAPAHRKALLHGTD